MALTLTVCEMCGASAGCGLASGTFSAEARWCTSCLECTLWAWLTRIRGICSIVVKLSIRTHDYETNMIFLNTYLIESHLNIASYILKACEMCFCTIFHLFNPLN